MAHAGRGEWTQASVRSPPCTVVALRVNFGVVEAIKVPIYFQKSAIFEAEGEEKSLGQFRVRGSRGPEVEISPGQTASALLCDLLSYYKHMPGRPHTRANGAGDLPRMSGIRQAESC